MSEVFAGFSKSRNVVPSLSFESVGHFSHFQDILEMKGNQDV
jgi:hypothetical protein